MQITLKESVFGCEKEIEYPRKKVCTRCEGSRGEPGSHPIPCRTCGGMGQVRRNQGFFAIATTCPSCQGNGQTIANPCGQCKGAGLETEKKTISVKIPAGVDNGTRLRLQGEGDQAPSQGRSRARGGDLYVILEVEEHPSFQRDGLNIIHAVQISIVQAALGDQVTIETLDGEKSVKIPAGTQYGDEVRFRGLGVPQLRGAGRGDFVVLWSVVIPKKLNADQVKLLKEFADKYDPSDDIPNAKKSDGEEGAGGFFRDFFK